MVVLVNEPEDLATFYESTKLGFIFRTKRDFPTEVAGGNSEKARSEQTVEFAEPRIRRPREALEGTGGFFNLEYPSKRRITVNVRGRDGCPEGQAPSSKLGFARQAQDLEGSTGFLTG